ncbi:MAG: PLP-dependent aminotransferase family protein [Candidatus Nitrotoga sp.]
MLSLDSNNPLPLIEQIANAIKKMIDDKSIRPGSRMSSIRRFAQYHGISRFTVVQAYDKLVAMGYLQSKQGSGFYVSSRPTSRDLSEVAYQLDSVVDVVWLLRNSLKDRASKTMPGAWWLPASWMVETGIKKSLRALSLKDGEFLTAYGTPGGYLPLRDLLQQKLSMIGIVADTSQIILTTGVTHAMDLVTRFFVRPGDTVLVDDPGYFILFGGLKSFGAKIVGVPWNTDGPDTRAMEALIEEHHPKLFFTNTILHNPTGASISQPVAHRMLQLAEKYDMILVEDDIYGDFHPSIATRLATLDQLNRVIYVSSFSKSVSASLRVGYFACNQEIAEKLCNVKLLTGLTTSEVSERLMYQLLTDGHYRKHLDKLRAKLLLARQSTIEKLESLGFTIYAEPEGGMFIWAKLNDQSNAAEIASLAAIEGIMLAPGNMFRPNQEPSPWFRFNVAHCGDDATFDFFRAGGFNSEALLL